ncbi:MAG: radical SAM/SPASM domain-containing protein [Candidatus Aenigmatarchaeota archaeon]
MEKVEKIYQWKKGREVGPWAIELNWTNKCNLSCETCWQRKYDEKGMDYSSEVSKGRFISFIKEADNLNVESIEISGAGEPLIRKDLFHEAVKLIKKLGMNGSLITNGTLFDRKTIEMLVDIGWDDIIFSMDGPNAKINDFLRKGTNSFQRTTNTIKYFEKIKNFQDSEVPRLRIAPVISNKNFNKLPEFIEFASLCGVSEVLFQILVENTERAKDFKLSEGESKEIRKYIPRTLDMAEEYGIDCNADILYDEDIIEKSSNKGKMLKSRGNQFAGDEFLTVPCYRPWYFITVYPDGEVQPCPNIPRSEDDYEDVSKEELKEMTGENIKEKSLEEIWYGDYFSEYRKRMLNKNLFPWCEICCGNEIFDIDTIRKKLAKKMDEI